MAALLESLAQDGTAALCLEPAIPTLLQLLACQDHAWAGLLAAKGSGLGTLRCILYAANTPIAFRKSPALCDSIQSHFMNGAQVRLLLQHTLRGPDAAATHAAACLAHLVQQPAFDIAWLHAPDIKVLSGRYHLEMCF